MTPEQLTIEVLEQEIGPALAWHGQCFGVASAVAVLLGPEHAAVYGHYLSPVAKHGYWAKFAGRPFIQHGWVKLADGRVLDPTRWSFENSEPGLALIGPDDLRFEDYDEGGNQWRVAMRRPCPEDDGKHKIWLGLEDEARAWVSTLVLDAPRNERGLEVTIGQLAWLSNLGYDEVGRFVPELYQAIARANDYSVAFLPIDNRRRAEREHGLSLG